MKLTPNLIKGLLLTLIPMSTAFGQGLTCIDALGTPVPIMNARINDIGQATVYAGRPVILFNGTWARALPPNVATFFLYHECGHHALGHIVGQGSFPMANEQAADCWAARTLVESGQFDEGDIADVQNAIARFGRGDWSHLPGPMRAMNLPRCLASNVRDTDDSEGDNRTGHRAGCGIKRALDRYGDSDQTYQDAAVPIRAILSAEDETPAYSRCTDDELEQADSFFDDVIQMVRDAGHPAAEQAQTIRALRDSQRKIRRESDSR